MGGGYLASGTVPARPVPLQSGPIDRGDGFGDGAAGEARGDGTHG
jgi:hypothetical protein